MLSRAEIRKIARARLKDAEALVRSKRYDGAVYLCGYVIELGLKARICQTLRWESYPSRGNEFKHYASFKTHDLDVLLHLSGVEAKIKEKYLADWSQIAEWDTTARYKPPGDAKRGDVLAMIDSAERLLRAI